MTRYLSILAFLTVIACTSESENEPEMSDPLPPPPREITLDRAQADRLAELPLGCLQTPLPYKPGHIIAQESDLAMPIEHHPAFYGCFDWHSAVHGHWSLVYLLKEFPALTRREEALRMLDENLTADNILREVEYFSLNANLKSFERTYGWAWLLKLQEELLSWEHPKAAEWAANLRPLVDYISDAYVEYLPKLVYPIRVGEHTNTAFGLSFAYDYAQTAGDTVLASSIRENALRFYRDDAGCPIGWEPSGYDFLSPCLQELDIMRKVLPAEEFQTWAAEFLPPLFDESLRLAPGQIRDRSDGKLVHLDGLNFSRAWTLYPLRDNDLARRIADEHLDYSLGKITDGDYAGQHWLGSFALYAFKTRREADR